MTAWLRPIAGTLAALAFFAVVALVMAAAYRIGPGAELALVGLALLGAIYVATGGRAWFGTRERPERVLGKRVVLRDAEDGGSGTPGWEGVLSGHEPDEGYLITFDPPANVGGIREPTARIHARHRGYPVSRARRRGILAVNTTFESGQRAIGMLNLR